MKRLQIYIECESDEALAAEAARDGISKAEIIRRPVTDPLTPTLSMTPSAT